MRITSSIRKLRIKRQEAQEITEQLSQEFWGQTMEANSNPTN